MSAPAKPGGDKAKAGAEQPVWRQAFDRAEREVGPRLETVAHSSTFADVLSLLMRSQAQLRRQSAGALARLWHVCNLPAASDVKRLSQQVVALDQRLREITKRLDDGGTP